MAAVLVHIDLDGDQPHSSSLLALAAGRRIASSWGAALYAAVIVHDGREAGAADSTAHVLHGSPPVLADARARLAAGGADKVVLAISDAPTAPLWAAVGAAWQAVLDHLRPRLVLFGADAPAAAELGPRTGARIGARLLLRARPVTGELIELRDRDGRYARAQDGGAAVVLIGSAPGLPIPAPGAQPAEPAEVVVLTTTGGGDPRVELTGTEPIAIAQTGGALVALGDDALADAKCVSHARRLAAALGGTLVGGRAAAQAGLVPAGAVLERGAAIAPDLCVQVGAAGPDLAGATCVLRLGGAARAETAAPVPGALPSGKAVDGAIAGTPGVALAELVAHLELR